jgi:histidinol-phosphate phosphatase family protein
VINEELPGTYVKTREEFSFNPGVLENVAPLARRFGRIVIVSNQRGIGKGLMSEEDLRDIHALMQTEIERAGGRMDAALHCPAVEPFAFCRKPNPGMAVRAREMFAAIEFPKSIMVGNKRSDMQFGRAAGMFTVFVTTTNDAAALGPGEADMVFPDLAHFAQALQP